MPLQLWYAVDLEGNIVRGCKSGKPCPDHLIFRIFCRIVRRFVSECAAMQQAGVTGTTQTLIYVILNLQHSVIIGDVWMINAIERAKMACAQPPYRSSINGI